MEDSYIINKNNFLRMMWEDRKGLILFCVKFFDRNDICDFVLKWILVFCNG